MEVRCPAGWRNWLSIVLYTKKVSGSVPSQGNYGRQPIDVSLSSIKIASGEDGKIKKSRETLFLKINGAMGTPGGWGRLVHPVLVRPTAHSIPCHLVCRQDVGPWLEPKGPWLEPARHAAAG